MFYQFDKNHPETKFLLFVAAAASGDHTREALTYVYSDGGRIMATDGHRLHVYAPEECLPAGYYEIIRKTKTEVHLNSVELDLVYPDVDRVIPEAVNMVSATGSPCGVYAAVIRAMPTNTLEFKYFEAAFPPELMDSYQVTDGVSPVMFQGGKVLSVVMPVTC